LQGARRNTGVIMKYEACVFIGRFQPIHDAHVQIIEEALSIADKVIVSVGSAHRPKTIKNPWTAEERIHMIKQALKQKLGKTQGWTNFPEDFERRVEFVQVRDHLYNNTKWAAETYSKALLAGATQNKETAIIGCFKDSSSWYLNMFPQWSLHEVSKIYNHHDQIMNATDIRDEIFLNKQIIDNEPYIAEDVLDEIRAWMSLQDCNKLTEEYQFIMDYKSSWDSAPYAPVFVTTDAVVIKSGHILLIKRKFNPGKGLYALPGGFLNPNEMVEECAIRELKEETRIKVDKPVLKRSIEDVKVFDHPQRSLRGRTVTHAHLINLGEGPLPEIKANDDASGAHWIALADMKHLEDEMFEDHMDIITSLTSRF